MMSRKSNIIFANFSDDIYFRNVSEYVQKNLRFNGIDFISMSWSKNNKSTLAINTDDLVRPELLSKVIAKFPPSRFDVAKLLTDGQAIFLIMDTADRVFLKPKSLVYIKYYIQLLDTFWSQYITYNNVRAVVFESVPHMPWDLALFFVAKHFNVAVFIVRRTIYDNSCVITDDFRSGSVGFYENRSTDSTYNDFSGLPSGKSLLMKRSHNINARSLSNISRSGYKESFKKSLRQIIPIGRKEKKADYFLIGNYDLMRLTFSRRSNRVKSVRSYKEKCKPIDYNLDYIYFALHFRPERSTSPEGGFFSSQLDAINLLSAIVPDGVLIYVKEHPRQLGDLTPDLRRTHQAESMLYEQIAKLRNVRLVPLEENANDLIAHCRLTATITGSVAWEGLEIGKPAVVFGNTWHSWCESSLDISTCNDQKAAVAQLLSKTERDVFSDVKNFLVKFKEICFLGSNSYEMAANAAIGYEVLVESLGEGIAYLLRKSLESKA